MSVGHLYGLFREMSIQVFCSFLHWAILKLLNIISCLQILEINPLSVTSFANIFSQPVGCLFVISFPLLCKSF